ncbi:MAG: MerR family transcriptional regulator [Muribaculaceae bacterium]|nr:MerR family transcriptional regulator [Muribaculaceae bacterium]
MESSEFTKPFYKIKDVAEFVGVPQSTLRFWEQQFPTYVQPIRNAGKIRYYKPETIEVLRMIKYLLHTRGMKIEAVKEELKRNRLNISRRIKILDTLTEARSELYLLLKSLNKRK